jgi:hypothetical protein
MKMTEQEIRERADQALAMAEKFQERCHSAEDILAELVYLPWWRFGKRKKLREEFESHYRKFVTVSFNRYLEK